MKNWVRVLAVLMAMVMCLSCVSFAEEVVEEYNDATVLLTIDDREFDAAYISDVLYSMQEAGYDVDQSSYNTAIQYLIYQTAWKTEVDKLGLMDYTDDELAAIKEEATVMAQNKWDEALTTYADYFWSGESQEEYDELLITAASYYNAYGYDPEILANQYYNSLQSQKASDALYAILLEGKDLEPAEEDILATFMDAVNQDKNMIGENASLYEAYTYNYGYQSWWIPSGYRGIIHILIKVDDELLTAYNSAATQEEADAAKAAVLESRQKVIDDIYARLEKGETFQSLIALYGEDPGMQDESNLANGYEVNANSIVWDPVFTAAAFSEEMQEPGDVSKPVIGSYGIHILYYLREIPGGAIEMTDEIYQEIYDYLQSSIETNAYNEAMNELIEEQNHSIIINQDAIDYLTSLY